MARTVPQLAQTTAAGAGAEISGAAGRGAVDAGGCGVTSAAGAVLTGGSAATASLAGTGDSSAAAAGNSACGRAAPGSGGEQALRPSRSREVVQRADRDNFEGMGVSRGSMSLLERCSRRELLVFIPLAAARPAL